ncbi:Uncharacterised protein [Shigella sonnei]|nr:Uncharacterised protein [Shigella sonnei]CSR61283.1 Uncharacterised protein [Shigella sonnei]
MLVNESRQRFGCQQHNRHRNHYRRHHHRQMVNHPYCSNYRIQREDGVKDDNLCDDHPETGVAFTVAGIMIAVFQPFMQFGCCFEQQEYPPEQHNQVASGEGEIHDGK